MAAVVYPFKLTSLDLFIRQAHGGWRALTPSEDEILLTAIEAAVQYVQERWPVDTGTSKDQWTYEASPPNDLETWFEISNPMFYAEWVHYKGGDPESPIWRWLIPEAVNATVVPALSVLKQAVLNTERRIQQRIAAGRTPDEALLSIVREGG